MERHLRFHHQVLAHLLKTKKNGEVYVEQRLHGPVMSYEHDSVQYLAVAGGGRADDAELIVFKLGNVQ